VPLWNFRFGDVFDPDDPLSIWICTLGIAFNDIIHANVKAARAETAWERFYEWRVLVAHFNEACLHLERGRDIQQVRQFLDSDQAVLERYGTVLRSYDDLKGVANRFRNEATFHYPYASGREAVARALRELAHEEGAFGGVASSKLKDSRQFYADDVVAHLVWNAAGGSEEAFESAAAALGEAVTSFGRFANAALDAYFFQHRSALQRSA
jgi:hypothetical protein